MSVDVRSMSFAEKSKWLRQNPVTPVWHFQYCLNTFFQVFLKSRSTSFRSSKVQALSHMQETINCLRSMFNYVVHRVCVLQSSSYWTASCELSKETCMCQSWMTIDVKWSLKVDLQLRAYIYANMLYCLSMASQIKVSSAQPIFN